jgi:hypothetical protein
MLEEAPKNTDQIQETVQRQLGEAHEARMNTREDDSKAQSMVRAN